MDFDTGDTGDTDDSFTVDTGDLANHATTLSGLTGQLNATLTTAQGATLSPDAFGQSGVGLVPAIQSVTTAGQDALRVQVASLDTATSGISATAAAYQRQDIDIATKLNAISDGLPPQPAADPQAGGTPVLVAQNGTDTTQQTATAPTAGVDEAGQPTVPAAGSKPGDVNAWWQGLNQDQKKQYTDLYSQQVGALDGVPAAARDYANRQVLPNLIQQTQDQLDQLKANQPQFDSANPGQKDSESGVTDADVKYSNDLVAWSGQVNDTTAKLGGLNAIQNVIGPNQPFPTSDVPALVGLPGGTPPKFLLGVDANDLGHAIIASNNPDAANNVVTLVPGMNTRIDDLNVNWYTQRTDQLVGSATQAGGPSTSVISWLNYTTPQDPSWNGLSSTPATNAAPGLIQFQQGLDVTHGSPDPLVTWLGHSYGTDVIGQAALATPGGLGSLGVTNVIVAGSPGMNVARASDLGVQNVWATEATNDVIQFSPPFVHSIDPTGPAFGANVFDAGAGSPDLLPGRAAHSSYFDVGSPALTNMGNIITGHYGQVTGRPVVPLDTGAVQP